MAFQKVNSSKKHPFRVYTDAGVEVTTLVTPTVTYSIDGALPVSFADPEISTYNTDFKRFLLTVQSQMSSTAYETREFAIVDSVSGKGTFSVDFVPDLSLAVSKIDTVDTVVDAIKVKTDALTLAAIQSECEDALSAYYNPTESTTNVRVLIGTYDYRGVWYSLGDTFDCESAQATRDIALGYLEATGD